MTQELETWLTLRYYTEALLIAHFINVQENVLQVHIQTLVLLFRQCQQTWRASCTCVLHAASLYFLVLHLACGWVGDWEWGGVFVRAELSDAITSLREGRGEGRVRARARWAASRSVDSLSGSELVCARAALSALLLSTPAQCHGNYNKWRSFGGRKVSSCWFCVGFCHFQVR